MRSATLRKLAKIGLHTLRFGRHFLKFTRYGCAACFLTPHYSAVDARFILLRSSTALRIRCASRYAHLVALVQFYTAYPVGEQNDFAEQNPAALAAEPRQRRSAPRLRGGAPERVNARTPREGRDHKPTMRPRRIKSTAHIIRRINPTIIVMHPSKTSEKCSSDSLLQKKRTRGWGRGESGARGGKPKHSLLPRPLRRDDPGDLLDPKHKNCKLLYSRDLYCDEQISVTVL